MTLHIADIASYQLGLTVTDLKLAGFRGINVKISHGMGTKSVHPNVHTLVQEARERGMQVGTFHWLTGEASGQQQAAHAYARMQELPYGTAGLAHTVDVEATTSAPTRAIYRDYCTTMAKLLGRPIATYTGDWWWMGRAWEPAPESPWLWSAPIVGYLEAYPGDISPHWAGYGGWPMLTVMQYRVARVGLVQVSQSAVAEDDWERMCGMAWENTAASNSLLAEFNEAFPNRDKRTDGTKGDDAHAQRSSDHNPDETGRTPYEDADTINEVHARDIGDGLNRSGWTMRRCIDIIVARHRTGQDSRLQNIIHHGKVISRTWGWSEWRPASGHETWAHFGFRYGSGSGTGNPENITKPWGILAAINEGDDMTPEEMTTWARSTAGKDALGDAFTAWVQGAGKGPQGQALTSAPVGNSGETVGIALQRARSVDALIPQILTLVQNASAVDVQELAEAMGPIVVAGLVPEIGELDGISPEEVEQRVKAGVRAVLGQLDNA